MMGVVVDSVSEVLNVAAAEIDERRTSADRTTPITCSAWRR